MTSLFTFGAALLLLTIFNGLEAFVIEKKFTDLCGQNLTLAEPNESLKIDFNVPTSKLPNLEEQANCTSFILWTGDANYKLLPYTARSPHPLASGVDGQPEVVLSITDVQGKLLKLQMFGSKPFYLSITPVVKKSTSKRQASIMLKSVGLEGHDQQSTVLQSTCPEHYTSCGQNECIHSHFACDSVYQCATDELACFDMPSDYFLILSFTGVMLTFGLVSLFLALYVYCRFYRHQLPTFLLSADYKPTYYGTVNGSFDSSSSSYASLLQGQASSAKNSSAQLQQQQQFYEQNILQNSQQFSREKAKLIPALNRK